MIWLQKMMTTIRDKVTAKNREIQALQLTASHTVSRGVHLISQGGVTGLGNGHI